MKNYSEEKYNEIIGGSSNEKDIVRKICEFIIYFLRTEYETLIFAGRRIVHSHHRKCHPNFPPQYFPFGNYKFVYYACESISVL